MADPEIAGRTTAGTGFTPGPWRLQPFYGARFADGPVRNRYAGIYQPVPGQQYGSLSSVVTVGIKGIVDDDWLNIKDADARLIAAAPDLYAVLQLVDKGLRSGAIQDATLAVARPSDKSELTLAPLSEIVGAALAAATSSDEGGKL